MAIRPDVLNDIATERQRQISKGFDAAHDDAHDPSMLELVVAHIIDPEVSSIAVCDGGELGWADHIATKYRDDPYRRAIVCTALLVALLESLKRKQEAAAETT